MNDKLQETKELLVELIAEVTVLLEDVRQMRDGHATRHEVDGEPEYVRNFVYQREVLMNVAAMLADVQFEWTQEPQRALPKNSL